MIYCCALFSGYFIKYAMICHFMTANNNWNVSMESACHVNKTERLKEQRNDYNKNSYFQEETKAFIQDFFAVFFFLNQKNK